MRQLDSNRRGDKQIDCESEVVTARPSVLTLIEQILRDINNRMKVHTTK